MPKQYYLYPADTAITPDKKGNTFLSDPKINAELYNYLMSLTETIYKYNWVTTKKESHYVIDKMPTYTEISKNLTSRYNDSKLDNRTIKKYIAVLEEKGYLVDYEEKSGAKELTRGTEKSTVPVTNESIDVLNRATRPYVVKIYIYLLQKYNRSLKYKDGRESCYFTKAELAQHLGLNCHSASIEKKIDAALDVLQDKFIRYQTKIITVNGQLTRVKLLLTVYGTPQTSGK